jgi:hypothetical protein
MKPDPQSSFPTDYRRARQAFIAACEDHGIDVISRVNPQAKGPDGAPLFLDVAATGPRDARKALILLSGVRGVDGPFGSAVQTRLIRAGVAPPPDTRLVMIHALNPFGFAWNRPHRPSSEDDHDGPGGRDIDWPTKALATICTEDLAKARKVIAISFQTGQTGQTDKRQAGQARMIVGDDKAHAARARAVWGNVVMADTYPDGVLRDGLAKILAPAELTFAALEVGMAPPDIIPVNTQWPANTEWQEQAWDHARRCVTAALAALH